MTYDARGRWRGSYDAASHGVEAKYEGELLVHIHVLHPNGDDFIPSAFDERGRLVGIAQSVAITWGPHGVVEVEVRKGGGYLEYDDRGRLAAHKHYGNETTYRYDAAGYIVEITGDGETTTYAYDESHRITRISTVDLMPPPNDRREETSFRHDASGRLIEATTRDREGTVTDYRYLYECLTGAR